MMIPHHQSRILGVLLRKLSAFSLVNESKIRTVRIIGAMLLIETALIVVTGAATLGSVCFSVLAVRIILIMVSCITVVRTGWVALATSHDGGQILRVSGCRHGHQGSLQVSHCISGKTPAVYVR